MSKDDQICPLCKEKLEVKAQYEENYFGQAVVLFVVTEYKCPTCTFERYSRVTPK